MLRGLLIELRSQSAFWVALGWVLEAVFFRCQDVGPSVDEQILFSLKLLLLLFQAPCSGYELKLKALLLQRGTGMMKSSLPRLVSSSEGGR